MTQQKCRAFSMVELIFVIVIIGILSAIAVPKFFVTRDDAVITKAISTIASVRSAIATEKQKRMLRSEATQVSDLAVSHGEDSLIFDFFDNNTTRVLEYPLRSCRDENARGCWISNSDTSYTFRMPNNLNNVIFTLSAARFTCDMTEATTGLDCKMLTQ